MSFGRLWRILILLCISWSAHAQFVTIWQTDKVVGSGTDKISINRGNSGLFNVAYEDINNAANSGTFTNLNLSSHTLTFPSAGTYRLTITGAFTHMTNGGNPDAQKLLSVEQWGSVSWTSMNNTFSGCTNVVINAPDNPNLAGCTSLRQMFEAASSVNTGLENWNVSTIQDFTNMFAGASSFNGDISGWNMVGATNLTGMFAGASLFNQDINGWNVSNVTNMQSTFRGAASFNQNINNWNVSSVTRMSGCFSEMANFNQPLDNWDMSSVTDADQMFSNAVAFNQDISGWDVSNVNNFAEMFSGATHFNQGIGVWNMSNCTYAAGMFQNATSFNHDISNWNMANNTSIGYMFSGATSFNQDIGGWDVGNVTDMYGVFMDATSFNQDLSSWNTSNCTYMDSMFKGATSFNSNIDNWDVSDVTHLTAMFNNASSFNQNLGSWNVGQVVDMTDIFHNSGLSHTNYDNILIGWADLPVLQSNVTLGAQTNTYCNGAAAHELLELDYNWIFFDLGEFCIPAPIIPTISSFTPTTASTGVTVTITGIGFDGATAVTFGGVAATSFTVVNSTTITAVVGAGTSGVVAVTTPGGTGTLAGFTYQVLAPVIVMNNLAGVPLPPLVDLGNIVAGQTRIPVFTMINVGNAPAQVTSVTSSNPAFTITEQPTTIEPNAAGQLTISFTGSTPGLASTDITVTMTHETIQFTIQVNVENSEIEVFNAVTPNGDGAHDFLRIRNIELFPGNSVRILDRLGNEVYKVDNYENGTPGMRFEGASNSGKALTDGTYFYIIIISSSKKLTGHLLLQR